MVDNEEKNIEPKQYLKKVLASSHLVFSIHGKHRKYQSHLSSLSFHEIIMEC